MDNIVNKIKLPEGQNSGGAEIVGEFSCDNYQEYQSDDAGCRHIIQLFTLPKQLKEYEFNKVYIASQIGLMGDNLDTYFKIVVSGYATPEHVLKNKPIDPYGDLFEFNSTQFCQIYRYDQEAQKPTWKYLNIPIAFRWFEGRLIIDFPEKINKPDGTELTFGEVYHKIAEIYTLLQLIK